MRLGTEAQEPQKKARVAPVTKPTTCTEEARNRGSDAPQVASTSDEAEVEVLSEYFAQFVEVQSKMSPLAESMYA